MRRRRHDDLPACVQLLRAVHERDGYPVNWPADPAAWLDPVHTLAAWVAESDGVVGHVALHRATEPSSESWSGHAGVPPCGLGVVAHLLVKPVIRGHGLGRRLLDVAVDAASARGLVPVLVVVDTDIAAQRLYARAGWTRVETQVQEWGQTPVRVQLYVHRRTAGPTEPTESPLNEPETRLR